MLTGNATLDNRSNVQEEQDGDALEARATALERTYVHDVYEHLASSSCSSGFASCLSDVPRHPSPRVTHFLMDLEAGSVVADIGCGNGKYLGVRSSELCYVGVEACLGLAQSAASLGHQICAANNHHLPFRDDSIDAVLSVAVIHHFASRERRVKALKELARILRIGGKIIITVWAMEQLHRKFESQDILVPCKPPSESISSNMVTPQKDWFGTATEDRFSVPSSSSPSTDDSFSDAGTICEEAQVTNKTAASIGAALAALVWKRKIRNSHPSESSITSSSEMSSPGATSIGVGQSCYSFVRKALEKLSVPARRAAIYPSKANTRFAYHITPENSSSALDSSSNSTSDDDNSILDDHPAPVRLIEESSSATASFDSEHAFDDVESCIELLSMEPPDSPVHQIFVEPQQLPPSPTTPHPKSRSLGDILSIIPNLLKRRQSSTSPHAKNLQKRISIASDPREYLRRRGNFKSGLVSRSFSSGMEKFDFFRKVESTSSGLMPEASTVVTVESCTAAKANLNVIDDSVAATISDTSSPKSSVPVGESSWAPSKRALLQKCHSEGSSQLKELEAYQKRARFQGQRLQERALLNRLHQHKSSMFERTFRRTSGRASYYSMPDLRVFITDLSLSLQNSNSSSRMLSGKRSVSIDSTAGSSSLFDRPRRFSTPAIQQFSFSASNSLAFGSRMLTWMLPKSRHDSLKSDTSADSDESVVSVICRKSSTNNVAHLSDTSVDSEDSVVSVIHRSSVDTELSSGGVVTTPNSRRPQCSTFRQTSPLTISLGGSRDGSFSSPENSPTLKQASKKSPDPKITITVKWDTLLEEADEDVKDESQQDEENILISPTGESSSSDDTHSYVSDKTKYEYSEQSECEIEDILDFAEEVGDQEKKFVAIDLSVDESKQEENNESTMHELVHQQSTSSSSSSGSQSRSQDSGMSFDCSKTLSAAPAIMSPDDILEMIPEETEDTDTGCQEHDARFEDAPEDTSHHPFYRKLSIESAMEISYWEDWLPKALANYTKEQENADYASSQPMHAINYAYGRISEDGDILYSDDSPEEMSNFAHLIQRPDQNAHRTSIEQFSDADESSCTDLSSSLERSFPLSTHPSLNIVVEDFDHGVNQDADECELLLNQDATATTPITTQHQLCVKPLVTSRSISEHGSAESSTSMQTVVHAQEEEQTVAAANFNDVAFPLSSSSSCSDLSTCSDGEESAIVHRYYHVFRQGELDALIEKYVQNLHIIASYYDRASWCVVAEKVQVWTI